MNIAPSNEIAVILGTPEAGKSPEVVPFAHVVALAAGEKVAERARTCLHVFVTDNGGFDFSDGLVAVKDKCALVGHRIHWPELCTALRKPVKGYDGLTNTKPGEPPYLRIKNLAEEGYFGHDGPDGSEGWAVSAFRILEAWNEWVENETSLREQTREFRTGPKWASASESLRDAWVDSFRKQCGDLDLERGKRIDFDRPMGELVTLLKAALNVFRRIPV